MEVKMAGGWREEKKHSPVVEEEEETDKTSVMKRSGVAES